jgi:hypothetical protein
MKNRIILKATTFGLMIPSVVTLLVTVAINHFEGYSMEVLNWHMVAGLLFLSILPVHIYMMRQKLKKLPEQIYTIATTGEYYSSCASQLLPNALNKKTLGEFCTFMDLDIHTVRAVLMQNQILVHSIDTTIEKIAKEHKSDSSRIFAIILGKHVWNIAPIENRAPLQLWIAV